MEEEEAMSDSDDSLHSIVEVEDYMTLNRSPFDYIDYKSLSAIAQAVCTSDSSMLLSLIEKGHSIAGRDNVDRTPLHLAMLKNDLQILNILLEHPEIDLDTKNHLGETPLLQSIGTATDEMIYRLLDAGCDVNATNHTNTSALHLAINKQPSIAHELIKRGADVNAVNFIDGTPLHVAVRKNNLECVSMLLYYNADVTLLDSNHVPPLYLSINSSTKLEITQELVRYCPDFTIIDEYEYNCLLLALKNKHPIVNEIIELVDDAINEVTRYNETALHLALDYPTNAEFKLLWPKIDKNVILDRNGDFLITFVRSRLPTEDWLECFYMILDCEVITDLCVIDTYFTNIFSVLVSVFRRRSTIESSDRIKIIYALLSHDAPVVASALNQIYDTYGFSEELYAFTLVDCTSKRNNYRTIVACLMGKEKYFKCPMKALADSLVMDAEFTPANLEYLYQYFALSHWLLLNSKVTRSIYYVRNATLKFCEQITEPNFVPSLLELSRNMSRYYIKQRFDIRKTYMLHQAVRTLGLPPVIQDIILFKTPIYKTKSHH